MKNRIEFFRHSLTEEDIGLANQVMRSMFLTTGPMVTQFEPLDIQGAGRSARACDRRTRSGAASRRALPCRSRTAPRGA